MSPIEELGSLLNFIEGNPRKKPTISAPIHNAEDKFKYGFPDEIPDQDNTERWMDEYALEESDFH